MPILIADDHTVFRHGIAAILAADPDLDLVGEAERGDQAIQAVCGAIVGCVVGASVHLYQTPRQLNLHLERLAKPPRRRTHERTGVVVSARASTEYECARRAPPRRRLLCRSESSR